MSRNGHLSPDELRALESQQPPEPTRAKVYRAVKGSAVAGGLSLATLAAFAVPWATSTAADVAASKAQISVVRSAVDNMQADVQRCRQGFDRVEHLEPRIAALEAARAADAATLVSIQRQLDRIDAKLDRIAERK